MCRQSARNLQYETEKLFTRLAMRKAQKSFLESTTDSSVCSSLRPKVGKCFSNPVLEERKRQALDECRMQLVALGIEEANSDLDFLRSKFHKFFEDVKSSQPRETYVQLARLAKVTESRTLSSQSAKHKQKLLNHNNRLQLTDAPLPIPSPPTVERIAKHTDTKRAILKERNRRRRMKGKIKRK